MSTLAEPLAPPQTIRCAIYTRKSHEEGLEQELNSLDAQREAGEASIASQRQEGWVALDKHYDDGGYSGGSMERPALERLLRDVEAGAIDCVVVYKVDRLSRSLLDFARIIGLFEAHDVSFVSVTQQFNTATSMGTLLLNVLLSFAQFEREMIAERTRDKIAAARRKGKWTGGMPVLGYDLDPEGGRLVVNPDEAERVRAIFGLYLERRSLLAVVQELDRRGWRTKRHVSRKGRATGGKPFMKTGLSSLLRNPLYIGKVRCQGSVHPGEHEAIVDEAVWRRVQRLLRDNGGNGHSGNGRKRRGTPPLLRGLLTCRPCGRAMTQSVTVRGRRRYRYYVCLAAQKTGWESCPTKSVRAEEIESSVIEQIRSLRRTAKGRSTGCLAAFGAAWDTLSPAQRRRALCEAVERIDYDGPSGTLTAILRQGEDRADTGCPEGGHTRQGEHG
jgi:site-specific DNA recombinase